MQFFGLNKPFHPVAFLETETVKQQIDNIKAAIHGSGIIALTGMVGTGKTTLLWKIQQQLQDEKEVVVCRSLSTDKKRPSEVRAYLLGQLNSSKLQEFNKEIYKLGVI